MVTFQVLGPLTAHDSAGPLDLKGPRHRAVLARLLVARGRVVPVSWLVDDLWESPPEEAVGAIQTFVGALRKALEPDRAPRTPAQLLITVPPGYALRAEAVDAWQFEAAVAGAAQLNAPEALAALDSALGLWRGPAYAEFASQDWARAEAARLDELRLLAVERRAEAALALGQAAELVPDLQAHVEAWPLREDGWRLLALALYRSSRQGDALAALRNAREVLRSELGIDPGPGLRQAEADILAQAPLPKPVQEPFVGRAQELASLASAGLPRLVLISGAAGTGKTALVRHFVDGLDGWTVAWEPAWPSYGIGPFVAKISMNRPVVVIFDDLHWATEETVTVFNALVAAPDAGSVLVIGTFRSTEITGLLAETLGRAARLSPVRIYLGGLSCPEVEAMITAVAGHSPTPDAVRLIHQRSGGNPFFVRELLRLEGDLRAVPAGVRDVIRQRLAKLGDVARTHLLQAAAIGRDVDLDVLIRLAGDEEAVLSSVETAVSTGFLVEVDADRLQFTHALVQEALYEDIAAARRTRWHAAIADIVTDVEEVAHHLVLAGSRVDPARTARFLRLAAVQAEHRFAPHEAARLWRAAVDREPQLDALMGLVRALAVTGDLGAARQYRAEALTAAEKLGDPLVIASVLGSFDVPAIWTTNDDEALSARLVTAAEQTFEAVHGAARARLLITIAMERRADPTPRARSAALEAEAIARELDDPLLLCLALNGRYLQTCYRAGLAPERAALGSEILAVSAEHGLVTFEVLGHLVLVQAHAALADLSAADEHVAAALVLAEQYKLPLVSVFTDWYSALRLAITGDLVAAAAAYRAAATRLHGSGMPGVEAGILPLALLSVGVRDEASYGPYSPWVQPVGPIPDSPPDLLFEARTCLSAKAAVESGDQARMRHLYAQLLPAASELAGAGSGMLTFGPVAHYLAELADALGYHDTAAAHREHARKIAPPS